MIQGEGQRIVNGRVVLGRCLAPVLYAGYIRRGGDCGCVEWGLGGWNGYFEGGGRLLVRHGCSCVFALCFLVVVERSVVSTLSNVESTLSNFKQVKYYEDSLNTHDVHTIIKAKAQSNDHQPPN